MKNLKFLIPFIILSLFACNQSQTKKAKKSTIKKEEIKSEISKVVYPLPTPFELTKMLNEIEASFIFGITNLPENVDKYMVSRVQALNLGIYSADLAYATTYNLSAETQLFLESIKTLAKELDITGAIDPELATKVEVRLNQKEKLIEIITELFHNTYTYLHQNDNLEIAYLILTGTWIEGIYLTTHISENTFNNVNIVDIIMKQEDSLKKLIHLMEQYKESELIKEAYSILSSIKDVYELQEGMDVLSKKQLEKISQDVAAYREKIVN